MNPAFYKMGSILIFLLLLHQNWGHPFPDSEDKEENDVDSVEDDEEREEEEYYYEEEDEGGITTINPERLMATLNSFLSPGGGDGSSNKTKRYKLPIHKVPTTTTTTTPEPTIPPITAEPDDDERDDSIPIQQLQLNKTIWRPTSSTPPSVTTTESIISDENLIETTTETSLTGGEGTNTEPEANPSKSKKKVAPPPKAIYNFYNLKTTTPEPVLPYETEEPITEEVVKKKKKKRRKTTTTTPPPPPKPTRKPTPSIPHTILKLVKANNKRYQAVFDTVECLVFRHCPGDKKLGSGLPSKLKGEEEEEEEEE